jgi:tRNA U34 2-thiouridine synthase MnmA/TrmU
MHTGLLQNPLSRSRHTGHSVGAEPHRVRVHFDSPQRSITPGQSAVFYEGDVVVGGGVIEQVI